VSIKRNSIANYIGQSYSILIAIVITPLYLQYLGAEAYGLVGFFALMQAWLNLLDLGLSPTLGRQVAYARGRKRGFEFFKRLLKSFELIFIVLALVIIGSIYLSSEWVAQVWIKADTLDLSILMYCIGLMGVMFGLRWFAGLYRSGINGMEDQVWLSAANIILISFKFVGALILLAFITQDVRHFFEYQLVIGVFELLLFMWRFYHQLPVTEHEPSFIAFDWQAIKSVAPFALGIAYTAGIWILITQTDKLILSGILSLAEFGYFSLVALVAGGITALSGPISQAIMPRMTLLLSLGKQDEMLNIYRQASQVVAVITLSVALAVGLYAEPLIYAWTGDNEAALWGSKILIWFALGNGVLALSAFQYYLQSAFGRLRLHVIGSTIAALIQVPVIYYAAVNYGAEGAGIAWFSFRLVWFLCWTPIVHRQFVPGFHLGWMLKDILPIVSVSILSAYLFWAVDIINSEQSQILTLGVLIVIGLCTLMINSLGSSYLRGLASQRIKKWIFYYKS